MKRFASASLMVVVGGVVVLGAGAGAGLVGGLGEVRGDQPGGPAPEGFVKVKVPAYVPTEADKAALAKARKVAHDTAGKTDQFAASGLYDALAEEHPGWVEAQLERAAFSKRLKWYEAARECYEAVLAVDENHRAAQVGVATMLLWNNEYSEVIKAADAMLAKDAKDMEAAVLRAQAQVGRGDKKEGAEAIAKILERAKGGDRLWVLARVTPALVEAEWYEEAEECATEWIAAKGTPEGYACRADARRGLENYEEAIEDVMEGFKLNGGRTHYQLLYVGSQTLLESGKPAAAIEKGTDLLVFAPGDVKVEKLIETAVIARQKEMKVELAKGKVKKSELYLVPKAELDVAIENIPRWHMQVVVSQERIRLGLGDIRDSASAGDRPLYNSYAEGRKMSAVPEVYAASADSEAVYELKPAEAGLTSDAERAGYSAREYRVAAALAAMRTARRDDPGMTWVSSTEGYLEWGDFEERVSQGKLSERDGWIIKGKLREDAKDDLGALDAYQEASGIDGGTFTGTTYVLSQKIVRNPERRRVVMRNLMGQVDKGLAAGDTKGAAAVAKRMRNMSEDAAEGWVAQMKVMRAEGNAARAQEALEQALRKDGMCVEAQWLRAVDLEKAGKVQEAMLGYNMASLGQQYAPRVDGENLGRAIEARERLEKGQQKAALEKLYAEKANAAYAARDWAGAMSHATRVTYGFGPVEAASHGVAGICLGQLKRYKDAVKDLRKASEIDAKLMVYPALGDALMALNEYKSAASVYGEAIQREPKAENYVARGNAYLWMKEYAEAAADFKAAIEKGDKSGATQLRLAEALTQEDPDAAAAVCQDLIANPGKIRDVMGMDTVVEHAKARFYLIAEFKEKAERERKGE